MVKCQVYKVMWKVCFPLWFNLTASVTCHLQLSVPRVDVVFPSSKLQMSITILFGQCNFTNKKVESMFVTSEGKYLSLLLFLKTKLFSRSSQTLFTTLATGHLCDRRQVHNKIHVQYMFARRFSVYSVVKKGDFVARICFMNSSMNSGQKTIIPAS